VINGVGGNLVAVQASRISTALHRDAQLGSLADDDTVIFITPAAGFFGKGRLLTCQQIDSNNRELWL
jgi:solute carrier family 41